MHARFYCIFFEAAARPERSLKKRKRFKQPYLSATATHEQTNTSKHFLFLPVKREQG